MTELDILDIDLEEIDEDWEIDDLPEAFTFPLLYRRDEKSKLWKYRVYYDEKLYSVSGVYKYQKKELEVKTNLTGRSLLHQAFIRARNEYTKKLDGGYSTDECAEINTIPMNAIKYEPRKHSDIFPCIVNMKLDGNRCIAVIKNGKVNLFSRKGKEFPFFNNIKKRLSQIKINIVLDGELYKHGMSLQKIQSVCRRTKNPSPEEEEMQYHIFDVIIKDVNYEKRFNKIVDIIEEDDYIQIEPSILINNEKELTDIYSLAVSKGRFEGIMIRYSSDFGDLSQYVSGRSKNLIKMKPIQDAEAIITGFEECTGILRGTPVLCLCYMEDTTEINFKARIKGTVEFQKKIFNSRNKMIGKIVTFTYLERTNDDNFRAPYVISIRTSKN